MLFITNNWVLFGGMLAMLIACIVLLRYILNEYFTAMNTSRQFADIMTVASLFPPVIGPIIVLYYSLTPPAKK